MSHDDDSTVDRQPPQLPDMGKDGIAAMIADADLMADAETSGRLREQSRLDPPPGGFLNDIEPGKWVSDDCGLPPDCPIVPLGTADGDFYFLNTIGEMRVLNETSLGQKTMNSLFMGRHLYLYWAWPKKNQKDKVVGFRAEKATEALLMACGIKGAFDPVAQTRGRGAWLGPNNDLIIHCGDVLIENGRPQPLGEIGGRVYPTRPPVTRPWPKSLVNLPGPALDLLPLLKTWKWERPQIDPILLLGWIGAAMIGGALDHRPAVFIVGDKATGKSTLQQMLKFIFGRGLIQSADTTAAGIYQQLQFDSLPVAVDEFEAKADGRRAKAILELARAAFSGDVMLRGGDRHKGIQFNARSSFLFSAINTPGLEPQDLSREAILLLKRLPDGLTPPVIERERFGRIGRMIMRRMIDNWHRFPSTLQRYYQVLANAGHGGRGQDTFGTLLACADLILEQDAEYLDIPMGTNGEDLSYWGEMLKPDEMFEYEGADENWRLCINHILTARIDAWRSGSRQTVGALLTAYVNNEATSTDHIVDFNDTRRLLQQAGLSLQRDRASIDDTFLFIPNNNPLLHELFLGSKWAGSVDTGSWMVALRQAPEGTFKVGQGRVSGVKAKGTLFRLADIVGTADEDFEGDED